MANGRIINNKRGSHDYTNEHAASMGSKPLPPSYPLALDADPAEPLPLTWRSCMARMRVSTEFASTSLVT